MLLVNLNMFILEIGVTLQWNYYFAFQHLDLYLSIWHTMRCIFSRAPTDNCATASCKYHDTCIVLTEMSEKQNSVEISRKYWCWCFDGIIRVTIMSWTLHEAFVGDVNILLCRPFMNLLHSLLLDMENLTMKDLLVTSQGDR